MKKTDRITISKGKRFEIFKRDGFKCKYCGKNPEQDVILELDHIIPVSKGGGNEIENLITSCFDCNRGKRDNLIDTKVVNKNIKKEVEQLKKQAEILKDYYKYLKIKNKLNNDKISIYKFIEISGENPNEYWYKSIEIMIKKYGMEITIEGWKIFLSKDINDKKYFFGICKNIYNKQTIKDYDFIIQFYYENIKKYDSYYNYKNKNILIDIGRDNIQYFLNNYGHEVEDLYGKKKRLSINDQKTYYEYTDYNRGKFLIQQFKKNKEKLLSI